MPFADDLVEKFNEDIHGCAAPINEIQLFRALARAVREAAWKNKYGADVLEIHQSYVSFIEESGPFYCRTDRGHDVYCELADIMFIVCNNEQARLCFM